MGFFAMSIQHDWRVQLDQVKANIDMLKKHPDCEYLFCFMRGAIDAAEKYHMLEYPEVYERIEQMKRDDEQKKLEREANEVKTKLTVDK